MAEGSSPPRLSHGGFWFFAALGPSGSGKREQLEVEFLVDLLLLISDRRREQIIGHGHHRAEISACLLGDTADHLRRHELVVAGLFERVLQTLCKLRGWCVLHTKPNANAALHRRKLARAELFGQASITA